MSEEEQKKLFSRNLNDLLVKAGKTQKEVADAINVLPSTFNTWCTGAALPRMGKVQILADYFNVKKSELLEDRLSDNSSADKYYLNDETAQIAQEIHDNTELRALFSAAKDADPQTLKDIHDMLLIMKRRERGDTE